MYIKAIGVYQGDWRISRRLAYIKAIDVYQGD